MAHPDVKGRRARWGRVALVALLILLVLLAAAVLAGWLLLRSSQPGADPGKARAEVQRAYDKRWPRKVNVNSCTYQKDPEGSIFDWYDCRISSPCPRVVTFSVPRADALGRDDFDVLLPEGAGPRQLCGGQLFAGHRWWGHTRRLDITRDGEGREVVDDGCCYRVITLRFRLLHVTGTPTKALATIRVTRARIDKKVFADLHIRPPHVGKIGTLRLQRGVVTDELTKVTFCAEDVDKCGL